MHTHYASATFLVTAGFYQTGCNYVKCRKTPTYKSQTFFVSFIACFHSKSTTVLHKTSSIVHVCGQHKVTQIQISETMS